MDNSRRIINISYDQAFELICDFEAAVRKFRPEAVIGIARGGTVPATMLAHRLNLPCWTLVPSPGEMRWDFRGDEARRVVVVDDISSTGSTLARAVRFLHAEGFADVRTCTLFHDPATGFVPDVSHPAHGWIRFVWEFRDLTPGSRRSRPTGATVGFTEFEYCGLDLDGIFVRDLRRAWYRKAERRREVLPTVLAARDREDPVAEDDLPLIDFGHACVITGRPEEDFARTRDWLDRHGYAGLPLYCRPRRFSHAEHAVWKAHAVLEMGVSRYFESDLRQAIAISRACPATEVYWWGRTREKRIRIHVSEVHDLDIRP